MYCPALVTLGIGSAAGAVPQLVFIVFDESASIIIIIIRTIVNHKTIHMTVNGHLWLPYIHKAGEHSSLKEENGRRRKRRRKGRSKGKREI